MPESSWCNELRLSQAGWNSRHIMQPRRHLPMDGGLDLLQSPGMAGALELLARPAGAALGNSLQPDFAPPQEYRARTEYPLSAVEGLTIGAIEYDRGSLHLQHLAGLFVDKASMRVRTLNTLPQ